RAAAAVGADIIELHTGCYCHDESGRVAELARIRKAAELADSLGLECHGGHGLDFDTVGAIAAIPQMQELNIGHFLMGEAIFSGMNNAIGEMRRLMNKARPS
ncbi:MAG: pyridoxine 5'-phosphate synthase, partial [Pseudomonadota bacterium]|nr:pyridoxine 5'-phosphate synthase [Pseudomonadota bacterium]